jgi:hypothetical protein
MTRSNRDERAAVRRRSGMAGRSNSG